MEREAVTADAFLGGHLTISQPARGYRAGLDAILLAAAVPMASDGRGTVLDIGAGVGTIGLAVALRVPAARVILLEREPALADLARRNAARNGLEERVSVVAADVGAAALELEAAGLAPDSIDHVVANPPYFVDGLGIRPARDQRATSRAMPADGLTAWLKAAARAARPGGTLTLIHRPAALAELLAGLEGRFGGVRVKPLSAGPDEAATRILVHARKGSRAPLELLAPLVTHAPDRQYTAAVSAIITAPRPLSCFD